MRVLHSSFRYFPDRGGSETYVSSLIRGLTACGVESLVASAGEPEAQHEHNGVQVRRLGNLGTSASVADYSTRLRALATEWKPDVLHLHWQPGTIGHVLAAGWQPPCPLVLTYHHPAISCPRGDLIRFGDTPCTGVFSRNFCLPCLANHLGAPRLLAEALALLPSAIGNGIATLLPRGRLQTALRLGKSTSARVAQTHAFLNACERIFVLSEWTRSMLISSGVQPVRVQLARLGTHHERPGLTAKPAPKTRGDVLRGIFVGRLDQVKGVHLLAQAMAQTPELPVEIDVYGPLSTADASLAPFIAEGQQQGARLRFHGTLEDSAVVRTMVRYDFAVVCSQFFETGPYTVIEAFQAGLPVLGTDIGGINEMVRHDHNGWLVPFASVTGWVAALRMIASDPAILERWSQHVEWRRTMYDVAAEVCNAYLTVIAERQQALAPAFQV